ncbi:MAG: septum formation initiator family protein [Candidatus Yanofskybacteria bacterium]|nr:septum formation initiator family protein [Candidatus Yanofskybacteria bacterium]
MHPIVRSKIATGALVLLAGWFLMLAFAAGMRRHTAEGELQGLQQRIEDTQRENARLADEVERMRRPQWLALLARQRLNYRQPGETVVFVYKSEKSGTIVAPQPAPDDRLRWRIWWDWLIGSGK